MILDKMDIKEEENSDINLDELKESLINHICVENKAFFKSQQKNEDEINFDERKQIVENLLNSSYTRFLSRFGMNVKKEHLKFFELNSHKCNNEQKEMILEQIKTLAYNLDHQKILVKNRRYCAMIKLIKEKHYFSESEMKQRDPLLFEQLIGQYLTGEEKRARRRPDAKCDTLVDILLEGIDYERDCNVEKEQRKKEEQDFLNNDDSQSNNCKSEEDEDDEESDHAQWGNFEDTSSTKQQEITPSTSRRRKRAAPLITAGERDILREEFLGIMYNNFLCGKDKDFFDYSQVDNNEEYDETIENDQDCEDKYFDEEESQDADSVSSVKNDKMENSESEDELDIYMKHIEDNLKRQKNEEFQEEFDDD
ncbi:hypothetical protein PVAND_005710 [Polypedilum vanderplanki]|uniref:CCD97-like C-terminal domain-containing protein n=1 Tax=Polypedilum vanderplanki TaxID=319348 RepID=A0A9J6C1S6_POLVA|nr:hypothetical protein PVAND_005710 [Polypedilum vanderplanki]